MGICERIRCHALIIATLVFLVISGCSRQHYRVRADQDAYGRVWEKSVAKPWMPSSNFSVYPAPDSRLFDPTPIEDPCLPMPAPQLYDYQLPPQPERDSSRFAPNRDRAEEPLRELPAGAELPLPPDVQLPPPTPTPWRSASFRSDADGDSIPTADVSAGSDEESATDVASREGAAQANQVGTPKNPPEPLPLVEPETSSTQAAETLANALSGYDRDQPQQTKQVPIPESYWEVIPTSCLSRMFEFESVRKEYAESYGSPPAPSLLDGSPKLALEDIIELTLLNSRELQAEKEALYRVALALTLERFDYQLKPSVGNNGTEVDYTHDRTNGDTIDLLRIPTRFQLDKMLYTGGDILGRFANEVLLTFNGPQGFAVDVGSELLFELTQSILQRDIRLENLTLAERNLVYAARDYARFRKQLFVRQATDYYALIRLFRQIEINCQNYFTLTREFNQRSIEIKFGFAARTQLDQVEQQVINGRQDILETCTGLENALDDLKIRMGIPTEQPLNVDLSELNLLTTRDELAVNSELIERTRIRILREIQSETRSALVLIGGVAQLAETMLDSLRLRELLGEDPPDAAPLQDRLLMLRIEAADIDVEGDRADLLQALGEETPDRTKVFQRRRDVADELLKKVNFQLRLLLQRNPKISDDTMRLVERYRAFRQSLEQLEERFLKIYSETDEFDDLAEAELVSSTEALQGDLEGVADNLDLTLGRPEKSLRRSFEDRALLFADELLRESERFRDAAGGGLVPLDIEMDDAMMTALVQRFDLMNERGFVADDWRQIKYAADDLRSALNIRASQSIRSREAPFDFSFDDSTTRVGMTLDLPFNRRAQRNQFRGSIFSYQNALRQLMQLEDTIKLSVRRNLRTLTLDRQQYANVVAGAALASERVTGTELEVRGGFATSRDFLESQTAYVSAVSNVASRHISYIVNRLQLFLDLESLTVGDNGFWDELYDEEYQPEPRYQLPNYARPGYGELHPRLKYSKKLRRMQRVPDGTSMIHRDAAENRE